MSTSAAPPSVPPERLRVAIEEALAVSVTMSWPPMRFRVPAMFTPRTVTVPLVRLATLAELDRQRTSVEVGARIGSQFPESVRLDVVPLLVQVIVHAPAWRTWMFVCVPWNVAIDRSVAVMLCMPVLLRVAWNVRVPAVRVASAGSNAAESLLVKCSVSVNPVTMLPYASRAVTVNAP